MARQQDTEAVTPPISASGDYIVDFAWHTRTPPPRRVTAYCRLIVLTGTDPDTRCLLPMPLRAIVLSMTI